METGSTSGLDTSGSDETGLVGCGPADGGVVAEGDILFIEGFAFNSNFDGPVLLLSPFDVAGCGGGGGLTPFLSWMNLSEDRVGEQFFQLSLEDELGSGALRKVTSVDGNGGAGFSTVEDVDVTYEMIMVETTTGGRVRGCLEYVVDFFGEDTQLTGVAELDVEFCGHE